MEGGFWSLAGWSLAVAILAGAAANVWLLITVIQQRFVRQEEIKRLEETARAALEILIVWADHWGEDPETVRQLLQQRIHQWRHQNGREEA